MPAKKAKNEIISEGIILALASAGAYLFSFYYEKGYVSVFKIPISFIEIGLTSLLTFGAIIIGIFLFIMPIANLFLMFVLNSSRSVFRRTLLPVLLIALFVLIQIYLFGFSKWQLWLPFAIMLIVVVFFQFVFPLITQKGGNYSDKLVAQEETERQISDGFSALRKRFGNNTLIIILILLFGASISENAGRAEAIKQKEFLVANTIPEMVVLRVYGDNLICAPFDRATKEIETRFTILKVSGNADLSLANEDVGPLHLPITIVIFDPTPSATSTAVPTDITP